LIKPNGISVVIPNYNGANLLPQILPALYKALDYIQLPHEVILSDDSSTDASVQFIKNNFEQIKIIESPTNRGFSITINKGIFAAQYDLLLFLNSDVKLLPNYFEKQLRYFEMPDTFGVMGRIIGWDNNDIQDGGKYPSFHGVKIKTSGNYIPLNSTDEDRLYSMYLSGANALVSKEKLLQLKGFNEIFSPFYVEDFELSLRAWRMGWHCYYEHAAVCRHQTSTTIKSKSSKNYIKTIYNRNKMILHALHLPKNKLWFWYIQLFAETLLQTILGRVWFLKAVTMFFSSSKEITQSKNKFLQLQKEVESNTDVNCVVKKVAKKLSEYKIQKF
jgi:GT2 family glycosyltransferase